LRIILFGAPGSGKGTQGDLVAKRYGLPRISTGELLRQAVQEGTPLGKRAEAFLKDGRLVSDEIIENLVRERIARSDCRKGYILDGFPRTIAQAEALEKIDGKRPEIVIGIEVHPEVLIRRLSERKICPSCQAVYNLSLQPPASAGLCDICQGPLVQRVDDKPDVIRERIKVYHQETEKVKDYYLRKKVYKAVTGEGLVEDIFRRIVRILDAELGTGEASRDQR